MDNLVPIVMFLCIAAVLVLRPITRPLGRLLDAMARNRREDRSARAGGSTNAPLDERHLERVTDLLERLNSRIDMVEDRMQFLERLLDRRHAAAPHLVDAPGQGARLKAAD